MLVVSFMEAIPRYRLMNGGSLNPAFTQRGKKGGLFCYGRFHALNNTHQTSAVILAKYESDP